ncbi:MAG: hypothetical protein VKO65_03565 [Cyanobacteriota bacterium]|nr:hypothetical protein [Cyanobacteriota bacterium]
MTRLSLLASGLAAALAFGSGGVALAQTPAAPAPARQNRISDAQWQKMFPEHKQLSLRDLRARVEISQRGERCVSGAANQDALRTCMREQRDAMQEQRRRHMQEMRAMFERNGIKMPELKKGPDGKGGGWGRGDGGF